MSNSDTSQETVLTIDYPTEVAKVTREIKRALGRKLHRRGLVVAISGGIDSSLSAALAVTAVGSRRVLGLLLPERDSSPDSLDRGKCLAEHLGIEFVVNDIGPTLAAIGCYENRDAAIRSVFADYGEDWKSKIVIAGGLSGAINHFNLVVEDPQGVTSSERLPIRAYLEIVAATNHKQRIRKTLEYYHADRLNYAVVGTPNRLEYDQGFFVKNGDGAADIKPIAHLYKTQVYGMAAHLGLPEDICAAVPTTDTYSLQQGQDEFYFALPYAQMDIALWCYNNDKSVEELAVKLETDNATARFIYKDIETKRRTTAYLHQRPILMDEVNIG